MANRYPAACQAVINQFSGGAVSWATAAGVSLDDVRQLIAVAWLQNEDPARSVPRALGLRRLRAAKNGGQEKGSWVALDPTVCRAALMEETASAEDGLLPLRDQRGGLTRGIANDEGIGLRAAQKRLKRQRDLAAIQGDLFARGG